MKALKITGKILLWIAIVLVALLVLLWIGVTAIYFDYFNNSSAEFVIPGLSDNYVPQGFDLVEEDGTYLMCGYMSDGSASRIYVRSADGDTFYTQLRFADGRDYTRHAGGLCHNGEYLYLAGSNGVEVFSFADVMDGGDATQIGTIPAGHDIAYCYFYNGYLLAGNFYYPETYETPENHRITTPAGDNNVAIITIYQADPNEELGIDPTPVAAISTREKVQGICFTGDDEIVLSTSYSVKSSYLYYYTLDTERAGTVEILDTEVPLYYLDSSNLTKSVKMPPMSEELVYQDGKILVMCESACNKYIFGKLIRGWQVYGYNPD